MFVVLGRRTRVDRAQHRLDHEAFPMRDRSRRFQRLAQEASPYRVSVLSVTYDPNDTSGLRSMFAGDHATWPAVADPGADVLSPFDPGR